MPNRSESKKNWWKALTPERRASLTLARSIGQTRRWAQMTTEAKLAKVKAFTTAGAAKTREMWAARTPAERKAYLAAAHRGAKNHIQSAEHRAAVVAGRRNAKVSDETRAKLSTAKIGKPQPQCWKNTTRDDRVKRTVLARRAAGMANPSSLERSVAALLDSLGVAYVQQHPIGVFIVDFFVSNKNLVIECDGTYWHTRPGRQAKDAARDAWMTSHGLTVLRLPEPDIRSGSVRDVLSRIAG